MKLYTFSYQKKVHVGTELDGSLVKLPFKSMIDLIEGGKPALALAAKRLTSARKSDLVPLRKAKVLAPISSPGKIWCSGLNYRGHVKENPAAKFLADPRFFSKLPQCVIGPGEAILHPGDKFQVDWEVEFAVVFGKTGYRLTQQNAMNHVFGYTILHDVSARYVQFKDNNEQMGKNFETFCPLGPCIVTKDEIPEPEKVRCTLKVNNELKQDFTNEDWCFPLVRMIEWVSMGARLFPGDILSTGTGAGVGTFAKPQAFLKAGDLCELEISGIGKLINPVKANPYEFKTAPNS
ncbi:fumarylacetoacetate hydrolase family protein [Nibricoccus sp. IMCC34717]|uniref:fumarylacetoacetate hydrolase family protein n=1 Tax=Nibricoccus sp. IMCC34717 TaxID=3034021 RepID=UPI00384D420B